MAQDKVAVATFAGGCFWCTEFDFDTKPGVISAVSGYAGGLEVNAKYELVSSGRTSHKEAVQITYDPSKLTYDDLLTLYWRGIDPTDAGGQFVDRGRHYTTAIYYHTETQKTAAHDSRDALDKSDRYDAPIVTEILPYTTFFPAEDYHQDFYKTNPFRYKMYRNASGRPNK
ncbi:MAG: peptide-methionine (S)-S-oxide reductase MsrA [bacterium]|nr:peptide-methionine (S)-S-oxide reductase MsrA [bacterium]